MVSSVGGGGGAKGGGSISLVRLAGLEGGLDVVCIVRFVSERAWP